MLVVTWWSKIVAETQAIANELQARIKSKDKVFFKNSNPEKIKILPSRLGYLHQPPQKHHAVITLRFHRPGLDHMITFYLKGSSELKHNWKLYSLVKEQGDWEWVGHSVSNDIPLFMKKNSCITLKIKITQIQ